MEAGLTNETRGSVSAPRWQRIGVTVVRTLVAVVTLYLVFESVRWVSVRNAFMQASPVPLIVGILLLAANLGIRIWKWQLMVNCLRAGTTFREAAGSLLLGISLGSITPAELGEFAGRALHLPDARRSHLVGLTLLDRFQIMLVWTAFGVAAMALSFLRSVPARSLVLAAALLIPAVLAWRLDLLSTVGHWMNDRWTQRGWITRTLDGFGCLDRRDRARTLVLTVAFHLVLCLQMYSFVNAFGSVSLYHAILAASAVMFVKAVLPVSLADLGIREMASVYFFGLFGVASVAAVDSSLLLFMTNIVLPGAAGAFLWWRVRLTRNVIPTAGKGG